MLVIVNLFRRFPRYATNYIHLCTSIEILISSSVSTQLTSRSDRVFFDDYIMWIKAVLIFCILNIIIENINANLITALKHEKCDKQNIVFEKEAEENQIGSGNHNETEMNYCDYINHKKLEELNVYKMTKYHGFLSKKHFEVNASDLRLKVDNDKDIEYTYVKFSTKNRATNTLKKYYFTNTVIIIGLYFVIKRIYSNYKFYIIKIWFCGGICGKELARDDLAKFDAFIAYCHLDLELVAQYVEKLENGARKYKLCFYHRDWLPGESISDCILQTIEESKRIIIIMTKQFIESPWGRFEFRSAIRATSVHKLKRLIVILYPGVDMNNLDSELKAYMKYNTYLRRDDPHFWRKLLYAMPQRPGSETHF